MKIYDFSFVTAKSKLSFFNWNTKNINDLFSSFPQFPILARNEIKALEQFKLSSGLKTIWIDDEMKWFHLI